MPSLVNTPAPSPLRASFRKVPWEGDHCYLFRESRDDKAFPIWHYHPEYELTLLESPGGTCLVGDSITRLEAVSLLLLGPNLPHFFRFDESPSASLPHVIGIHLCAGFFLSEFFRFPELSGIAQLLSLARRGVAFGGESRDTFAEQILTMRKLNRTEKLLAILSLLQRMAEAPGKTLLSSADFTPVLDQRSSERIQRAYQFIYENFREPIGLAAISRAAGMSPHAFCRYFKQATGQNLMDVVVDIRIHHAARLLIETDETVGNICFNSGFASLSCFNRWFRLIKGLSPRGFRNRFRGLGGSGESAPDGNESKAARQGV